MIIAQAPYRVSFAGGGTDLPSFYRVEYGAVLSVTIARHMYVTVHGRFVSNYRIAYSKTQDADSIDTIEHEIVREAMRLVGIEKLMDARGRPMTIEVHTIGDVPAGTGMGSSSSLAVALLNSFYAFKGIIVSPERLAREACQIEIDILGRPIGRQDQYAAAFGGLNYMKFNPDGSVDVEPVACRAETLSELERRVLLIYTDQQRDANQILHKQSEGTEERRTVLRQMRDLAYEMRMSLSNDADLDKFSDLLRQGWELKRSMGLGISNAKVDAWYHAARKAGAQGGKLLGAGGGGFLLLLAPPQRHEAIREALGRPKELEFKIERNGCRIIFISGQH